MMLMTCATGALRLGCVHVWCFGCEWRLVGFHATLDTAVRTTLAGKILYSRPMAMFSSHHLPKAWFLIETIPYLGCSVEAPERR